MEYIVSHRVNYEPSGHKCFPDKRFKSREEAENYFNKQRNRCLKKAEKIFKEFPNAPKKDIFCDLPQDCLENHLYWGDIASFDFRDNYAIHTWELQYEEDFED